MGEVARRPCQPTRSQREIARRNSLLPDFAPIGANLNRMDTPDDRHLQPQDVQNRVSAWHGACKGEGHHPDTEHAMQVEAFFDPATWTLTYVVFDPDTRDAVVIDPVLDFDPLRVSTHETSNGKVLAFVREQGLSVHYVLDTHAHADHLSGSQGLKQALGAKTGIGAHITAVQEVFKGLFHFSDDFATDGSQWDVLVREGQPLVAGSLTIEAIHTPGHTPACTTYKIRDALFTGDTMFMPDFGTGRCDFPGGSAEQLYDSIQKLYALPDETRVFVGHDYQPNGRDLAWETSIGAAKRENIQLRGDTDKAQFVTWRSERDATLAPPSLIFQSVQVNADGGRLPAPESNGLRYLRMPMGVFG